MAVERPPGYQLSEHEEFLNPRQVEYFRRRLEKARTDLQRELEAIPSSDTDDLSREGDQTDHASADTDREFLIQNRERILLLRRQTERALVRLENGSYGYCEDTGDPIGLSGS